DHGGLLELPADAPSLDAVPFPSTPNDGAIIVMHTLKFADGVEHPTLSSYHDAEGAAAVAHGARITGWFKVEGTIMGDGRNWDQIRFHEYPSRAAFMAATILTVEDLQEFKKELFDESNDGEPRSSTTKTGSAQKCRRCCDLTAR
ncbi:MAG: hypothetical protein RLZZ260_403, partial [Actinomycetota bacterium]